MQSSVSHMYHFVCLVCRRSVKGVVNSGKPYISEGRYIYPVLPQKCAHCGGEMPYVGKWFTPPRRHDEKQWKKLAWMIAQGWPRAHRENDWQTTPAMSLREVRATKPQRADPGEHRLSLWNQHLAAQKKIEKQQRHKTRKTRQKKRRAAKRWQRQCDYQER